MKDELERAINEHEEAYKACEGFWADWIGTGKVLTPEALERWKALREREEETLSNIDATMLELFLKGARLL